MNKRIRQKIKELRVQLPEPQKCSRCPNPLFDAMKSSDEEPYVVDGKPVCRDCYFDELGDFIEKNPIGGYTKYLGKYTDEFPKDSGIYHDRRLIGNNK